MTVTIPQRQSANTVVEIDEHSTTPPTTTPLGRTRHDFDSLFRTHQPRLVNSLTLMCGDRETAADAVQDAFIRAHRKWRKVGRYEDPIGWVRRVAINRLRDEHRRSVRKRSAVNRLSGMAERASMEPTLPDDGLAAQLADLPPQQRRCLVLHYVEDLSVADIATTLDISVGTVKSTLSDARAAMRDRLGPTPTPTRPASPQEHS
ncbi:MAG: RNA polymerase sigma factor [Ilumatobacter sp.]